MQMVGFFARRIVLVSGGGSGPSALSRAVTLQNRAVEAAQAPANSKSRRFLGIGTSSKSRLTIALRGAERWADGALRVDPASGRYNSRGIPDRPDSPRNNTAEIALGNVVAS